MASVCVIGGGVSYHKMFRTAGFNIESISGADLICLTGGVDVSPQRYNSKAHPSTVYDEVRDKADERAFLYAVERGIPIVGICRGAQFLNVENGGSMFQNVDGHTQSHNLVDLQEEKVIGVTSTHHQMMRPLLDRCELVAVAEGVSSKREWMEKDGSPWTSYYSYQDVEVVFYPDTKSLCFQPHPEFAGADQTREYFFELIERYLGDL